MAEDTTTEAKTSEETDTEQTDAGAETPAEKAAPKTPTKKPTAKKAPPKASAKSSSSKPNPKPDKSLIANQRGRRYAAALELINREQHYDAAKAVGLVQQTSTTKFDATVEVHMKLGLDPRKAEQNIRGTVKLPAGTGKAVTVLAFVPAAQQAAAKKAGADYVADESTVKKIQGGWTDFDVTVATPDQMGEVAKLGKVLGPKGLMPNPKAGTVSDKPAEAIAEVKKGTIEFRLAKDATVHAGIGKASFSAEDLSGNLAAYYQAVLAAKPDDLKGTYIRSLTIASSMGPGIKVRPDSLRAGAGAGKDAARK